MPNWNQVWLDTTAGKIHYLENQLSKGKGRPLSLMLWLNYLRYRRPKYTRPLTHRTRSKSAVLSESGKKLGEPRPLVIAFVTALAKKKQLWSIARKFKTVYKFKFSILSSIFDPICLIFSNSNPSIWQLVCWEGGKFWIFVAHIQKYCNRLLSLFSFR